MPMQSLPAGSLSQKNNLYFCYKMYVLFEKELKGTDCISYLYLLKFMEHSSLHGDLCSSLSHSMDKILGIQQRCG